MECRNCPDLKHCQRQCMDLPDGKTYTGIWSGRTTSESFYSYDMAFYDGNEFLFSLHGGLSVVDGDVYVELTPDAMWGGFKSKIIK